MENEFRLCEAEGRLLGGLGAKPPERKGAFWGPIGDPRVLRLYFPLTVWASAYSATSTGSSTSASSRCSSTCTSSTCTSRCSSTCQRPREALRALRQVFSALARGYWLRLQRSNRWQLGEELCCEDWISHCYRS